jgi:hypothetical protein
VSSKASPSELEELVAEYLSALLGSQAAQNEFGRYIEVSPSIAYEFSVFTGAAYCTNPDFPFSARPFSKIFGKALDLSFTSSMFDRGEARYSFENLVVKYPFISSGTKRIYIKAYSDENDLRQFREILCSNDPLHSDILVMRIEYWKAGFGLEPLLEYSAAKMLTKHGYIVENQTPLSAKLGSPDLLAFRSNPLQGLLSTRLGLPYGFSLASLNSHFYLPLQSDEHKASRISSDDSIVVVGEAKVGGSKAAKQIKKYLDSGFYDKALFLTDVCSAGSNNEWIELCSEGFTKQFSDPKLSVSNHTELGKGYEKWLNTVTLCHLFFGQPEDRQQKFLSRLGLIVSSKQVPQIISDLGIERFIDEFEDLAR